MGFSGGLRARLPRTAGWVGGKKRKVRDDQRGIAFTQSSGDPFSNALFSSPFNKETALTNTELWSAAQSKLGAPQSACAPLIGKQITGSNLKVDAFGNNVKSATGVKGDGHRTIHDNMVNVISNSLRLSGIPHRGGTNGKPRHCKDVFSGQVGSLPEGQVRVLQKIIPDLIIDARDLVTADAGQGKTLLGKKYQSITTRQQYDLFESAVRILIIYLG